MTTLVALAFCSRRVGATSGRNAKVALLVEALQSVDTEHRGIALSLLLGELRQGKIGLGWKRMRSVWPASPAGVARLELAEVDACFEAIAADAGSGSTARKVARLEALLGACTAVELEFLGGVLSGGLRQGANAGVLVTAVAKAAGVKVKDLKRALMFSGDLVVACEAAFEGGAEALERFTLTHFRPVLPMLAQTAADPAVALETLTEAMFEAKLDGARVQVHRLGDEVRVYSRRLNEVTRSVPEVVEAVRALPVASVVLDGEVLALASDGTPLPFQATMRRFGRVNEVETLRESIPLTLKVFDCLEHNGRVLIDTPLRERRDVLDELLPAAQRTPVLITTDSERAETFFVETLEAGHEGLMAKSLSDPYRAGSRAAGWLKIKPAHTLDLVVLAAEWGHGRREGWLSNLHLGARAGDGDEFVMLGKTFKGMTDDLLAWQTEALLEREVRREGITVFVVPDLVVEVAFSDIQASPQYPGGVALRFARLKRYRDDLGPRDVDTLATVRAIREYGHRKR